MELVFSHVSEDGSEEEEEGFTQSIKLMPGQWRIQEFRKGVRVV